MCIFFLLQDAQQSLVCIESSVDPVFNKDDCAGVYAESSACDVASTSNIKNRAESIPNGNITSHVGMKKAPLPRKKRKIEATTTQHSQKQFLVGLEDFEDHEIQEIDDLEVIMN